MQQATQDDARGIVVASSSERRLATVLAMDMADYSRAMGTDEERALQSLRGTRSAVDHFVRAYDGHLFGVAGDSLMAAFSRPIDAVMAAIAVQANQGTKNSRPGLHMGAHVGDVLVEGNDLFGDVVNVAARLEQLADVGGLWVTGAVYQQVRDCVPLEFEALGDLALKNIQGRVPTWRARLPGAIPRAHAPRAAVTEKPSIVILPLANHCGDPGQDFLCDGVTDDLTTTLSKFRGLFVIARHSAFKFKDSEHTPQEIALRLGVSYVMTGSMRRTAGHLRISVQLADTASGVVLWAERYDEDFEDLLVVQDEIVRCIIATLAVKLEAAERARVMPKEITDMTAYELYLKASHIYTSDSLDALEQCRELYELATQRDPTLARAWAELSYVIVQIRRSRCRTVVDCATDADQERQALRYARMAVHLAPDDYVSHWTLASICLNSRRYDNALQACERALQLNPNDAALLAEMGETLICTGHIDRGIAQVERAMTINPFFPEWYSWVLGFGLYFNKAYERVPMVLTDVTESYSDAFLALAASFAQQGRKATARQLMAQFIDRRGGWSIEDEDRSMPIKDPAQRTHWLGGLRKAGLPSSKPSAGRVYI